MTRALPRQQPLAVPSLGLPSGTLQGHAQALMQLHRCLDPLVVMLVLAGVMWFDGHAWRQQDQLLMVLSGLMVSVLSPLSGLYGSLRLDAGQQLFQRVLGLWAMLFGGISALLFVTKTGAQYSRQVLLLWAVATGVWLLVSHVASRVALRQLRTAGLNSRCDGYVGTAEGYRRLALEIEAHPWLGHRLLPVMVWPEGEPPERDLLEATLREVLQSQRADQWLLDDCGDTELMRQVLLLLEQQNQPVLLVPHWLTNTSYSLRSCQLGSLPALMLWEVPDISPARALKRVADQLVALLLLVGLSPLLAVIAMAIRLDSAGPVLFVQRRYGLNGRPFGCVKFRTMRVQEDGPVVTQASRNDPRVTAVGRLLRSWNLDELPQLLNVLRGEMSLVGPRPHAAAHNEYYRKELRSYMRRHALRPGITGWAQVQGMRGETSTVEAMARRMRADLDYIHHWSLLLDLRILLLTLWRWRSPQAY